MNGVFIDSSVFLDFLEGKEKAKTLLEEYSGLVKTRFLFSFYKYFQLIFFHLCQSVKSVVKNYLKRKSISTSIRYIRNTSYIAHFQFLPFLDALSRISHSHGHILDGTCTRLEAQSKKDSCLLSALSPCLAAN